MFSTLINFTVSSLKCLEKGLKTRFTKMGTFSCIYILLSRKDEELYDEALRVLAGFRNFTPDVIMTDFQRALRNSLHSAFLT